MLKIVARAEQKYGYKPGEHQRVIVEHPEWAATFPRHMEPRQPRHR